MELFTVGNIITLGLTFLSLFIVRYYDKHNRSVDLARKYGKQLKEDITAFANEKAAEVKDNGLILDVQKTAVKEALNRLYQVNDELTERANAIAQRLDDVAKVGERISAYDKSVEDLIRMTKHVEENVSHLRAEAAFVEDTAKKIKEVKNKTEELGKNVETIELRFERENADALERAVTSVITGMEDNIKELVSTAKTVEQQVEEHRSAVDAIEAERKSRLDHDMAIVNRTLEDAMEKAAGKSNQYEEAALVKLKEEALLRINNFQNTVEEKFREYHEIAKGKITEIQEQVKTCRNEWKTEHAEIEAAQSLFYERITAEQKNLQEQFSVEQQNLQDTFTAEQQGFREHLAAEQRVFHQQVLSDQQNLREQVLSEHQSLSGQITAEQQGLRQQVTKEQQDLREQVTAEQQNLREQFLSEHQNLSGQITTEQQQLREQVTKEQQDLQKQVTAEQEKLREQVTKEHQSLSGQITAEQQQLREQVALDQHNLRGQVASEQENLRELVTTEQQNLRGQVTTDIQNLQEQITTEQKSIHDLFTTEQQNLREQVAKDQHNLREQITAEQKNIHELFKTEQQGLREQVASDQHNLREQITAEQKNIHDLIKTDQENFREQLKAEQQGVHDELAKEHKGLEQQFGEYRTAMQHVHDELEKAQNEYRVSWQQDKDSLEQKRKEYRELWQQEYEELENRQKDYRLAWQRDLDALEALALTQHEKWNGAVGETEERFARLKQELMVKSSEAEEQILKAVQTRLEEYRDGETSQWKRLEALANDSQKLEAQLRMAMEEAENRVRRDFALFEEEENHERKRVAAGFAESAEAYKADFASLEHELKELKERAYDNVSEQLKVFEDDFFSDIARRKTDVDRHLAEWNVNLEQKLAVLSEEGEQERRAMEASFREETSSRIAEQSARLLGELERLELKSATFEEKIQNGMDETERRISNLTGGVEDIKNQLKEFTAQTRLFEKTDELKADLERSMEKLKAELSAVQKHRDEADQLEMEFIKIRRLEDEVNSKMTRFLTEKNHLDIMEKDFERLIQTSQRVEERLREVTGADDTLQNIQVSLRKLEDAIAAAEDKYQRVENKNQILEETNRGIERNFEILEETELALRKCRENIDHADEELDSFRPSIEKLAAASEKARVTEEKLSSLDTNLAAIEERMEKMQVAREWLSRAETRFEELNQKSQQELKLLEAVLKDEGKKANVESKGAPPLAVRDNVIRLARQGWGADVIARNLKIGRGEVELILEMGRKD